MSNVFTPKKLSPKLEAILYHEHHVSTKHPQMPMYKRAAQFACVNMTPTPDGDPDQIKEYWAWDGDQSYAWIEGDETL